MFTQDDLVDVLFEHIQKSAPNPASPAGGPKESPWIQLKPVGRTFLTDYELRRKWNGSGEIRVPRDAILSPLALEWLALNETRIIHE